VVFARWRRRLFQGRRRRTRALHTIADVHSPQLGNRRTLTIYVPPAYAGRRHDRYPVIYMQDGQNLFSPATSFAGDWGLVPRLDALAASGEEAIVVGVWNAGDVRLAEYSPFRDAENGGGAGDRYLAFLAETVKPIVDQRFRTKTGRQDTGIAGSSMGGLISLYAALTRPETFGFAAALSPSVWFADSAIVPFVEKSRGGGPVYLDAGGRESERQIADVRRLRDALVRIGYRVGEDLMYVEDAEAGHNEAAWGRRFPAALGFLLSAARRERSERAPAPPPAGAARA